MKNLRVVFLFCLLLVATPLFASKECQGLIEISGNLWSVDQDGNKLSQYSADGFGIMAANWSPDQQKLAYSQRSNTVTVLNSTGAEMARITLDSDVRIIENLGWLENGYLWIDGEVGPRGGYFYVYKPSRSGYVQVKKIVANGGACSISPNLKYLSCINSDPDGGAVHISNVESKDVLEEGAFNDLNPTIYPAKNGPQIEFITDPVWSHTSDQLIALTESSSYSSFLVLSSTKLGWTSTTYDLLAPIEDGIYKIDLTDQNELEISSSKEKIRFRLKDKKAEVTHSETNALVQHMPISEGEKIKQKKVFQWICKK